MPKSGFKNLLRTKLASQFKTTYKMVVKLPSHKINSPHKMSMNIKRSLKEIVIKQLKLNKSMKNLNNWDFINKVFCHSLLRLWVLLSRHKFDSKWQKCSKSNYLKDRSKNRRQFRLRKINSPRYLVQEKQERRWKSTIQSKRDLTSQNI